MSPFSSSVSRRSAMPLASSMQTRSTGAPWSRASYMVVVRPATSDPGSWTTSYLPCAISRFAPAVSRASVLHALPVPSTRVASVAIRVRSASTSRTPCAWRTSMVAVCSSPLSSRHVISIVPSNGRVSMLSRASLTMRSHSRASSSLQAPTAMSALTRRITPTVAPTTTPLRSFTGRDSRELRPARCRPRGRSRAMQSHRARPTSRRSRA